MTFASCEARDNVARVSDAPRRPRRHRHDVDVGGAAWHRETRGTGIFASAVFLRQDGATTTDPPLFRSPSRTEMLKAGDHGRGERRAGAHRRGGGRRRGDGAGVPADIRKDGGVARMSDPTMIKAIKEAVTIPVMAKARTGTSSRRRSSSPSASTTSTSPRCHARRRDQPHQQAQLQGARASGCATWARRSAASPRARPRPHQGRGRDRERGRAVRHCRAVMGDIRRLRRGRGRRERQGDSPSPSWCARPRPSAVCPGQLRGGRATPADAALMMQLGMDGVSSGPAFESGEPASARASCRR